jgi:hypothetical protein
VPAGSDMTEDIRDELWGKIREHCVKKYEEYLSVVLSWGNLGVWSKSGLPKTVCQEGSYSLGWDQRQPEHF